MSPEEQFALDVVNKLRQAGHEALWAGGCVRDRLVGKTPKDYDVATSALPAEVRELFGRRRTLAVGEAFGVIVVLGRRGTEPIEVATFRKDDSYSDGRRPDSVTFSDAEEDAKRRDFTINGLFYDPIDQQIIDYVDGQSDLKKKIIRAIGNAPDRFTEDKLRMLRAVRFAANLKFKIEPKTLQAIQSMAPQITQVSAERIGSETRRMLSHATRAHAIELLSTSGLLEVVLPEITSALDQAASRDTLWNTLKRVYENLAPESFPVALAALLKVTGLHAQGNDSTLGKLATRFRLSNKEADEAAWLLRHIDSIAKAKTIPWPKLQRILIEPFATNLLALHQARTTADDENLLHCQEKLALPPEQLNPPPLVTGKDLIAQGLKPGRHFQSLLEQIRDAQLEGQITSTQESLDLAKRIAANK